MLRNLVRSVLVGVTVGAIGLSSAWAAAVMLPAPAGGGGAAELPLDVVGGSVSKSGVAGSQPAGRPARAGGTPPSGYLAGTSKLSITPDPPAGERWQTQGCALGFTNENAGGPRKTATPDCIYMGGRGLGASEPITQIDPQNGLFVRTVALRDPAGDTIVLSQVDGVYWFGRYATMCERCGSLDIAEDLSAELGLDPSNLFVAGNHSHNSPDFIGGWGGVPTWYMEQVGEAIRQSVRDSVAALRPAVVEHGEVLARDLNAQRRAYYWSAEDAGLSWFRALEVPRSGGRAATPIATVAAFSAHPVTTGYDGGRGHADWPGAFSNLVAERDGGLGIAFVGGLGNMLTRQGTDATAQGLHSRIAAPGSATPLEKVDVSTAQVMWDQPITNAGLVGFSAGMFFDRPLDGAPNQLRTGKAPDTKPCATGSAVTARTSASAAVLGGELAITGGPGELFSNLSNTLKEQTTAKVMLPLANVNDGLGYVMQSFETDHAARQVLGFTDAPVEYEDAFSVDHCFGDMVLETTLRMLGDLGVRAD